MGKYLIKGSILRCNKGERKVNSIQIRKQFLCKENQQEQQKTVKQEFMSKILKDVHWQENVNLQQN